MNRFVAAFMLLSGLILAGGAVEASTTYTLGWDGTVFTPSQLTVNPGDTITLTDNSVQVNAGFNFDGNITPVPNNGNPFPLNQNGIQNFSVGAVGTASIQYQGSTTVNISIVSPSAPIPSLSEWNLLVLALMVMSVIGSHFRNQQS